MGQLNFLVGFASSAPTSAGVALMRLPLPTSGDPPLFDFATTGATAGTFTASPSQSLLPLTVWQPVAGMTGALGFAPYTPPAAITTGWYLVLSFDTSVSGSPAFRDASPVYIANGSDVNPPTSATVDSTTITQIAAAILKTPANLLATDASGYVTATNGGGGSFPAKAPDGWITGAAFAAGVLPANFAAMAITTSGQVSGTFTLDAWARSFMEGGVKVNGDGSWTFGDADTGDPRMKFSPLPGGGRAVTRY